MIAVALGGKRGGVALVDDEDAWVLERNWHMHPNGYAQRARPKVGGKSVGCFLMHREILDFPDGPVDHINRDRLDNRRSNLRAVTWAENAQNRTKPEGCTSQFRGVTRDPSCDRWRAAHELNGQQHFIGSFLTELAAADAALKWRRVHMPAATD